MSGGFNQRMVLGAVIGLFLTLHCMAGITGSITGKVVDQNGNVLQGVTVTVLRNTTSQGIFTVESSKKGSFRVPQLNPGTYVVRFEKEGLETVIRENVRVPTNGMIRVEVLMQPPKVESGGASPEQLPQGAKLKEVETPIGIPESDSPREINTGEPPKTIQNK